MVRRSLMRVLGLFFLLLALGGTALFYSVTRGMFIPPHGGPKEAANLPQGEEYGKSPQAKKQGVEKGSILPSLSPLRVLLLGVDSRQGEQARADTIMLAVIHPQRGDVHILSIPRDTYVQVPGRGYTKINHAMYYGGIPLMKETVSRFLRQPVDYAVVLDFVAFQRLVDEMGGLRLVVEKNMDYDDPSDGTHIHLRRGEQWLNGKQVLDYARFRRDAEADSGRMRRQQQVIRAMIREGTAPNRWPRWFQLAQTLGGHVKTDLPPLLFLRLAKDYAVQLEPERFHAETVRGVNRVDERDGLWYFFVSEDERKRLQQEIQRWVQQPQAEHRRGNEGR